MLLAALVVVGVVVVGLFLLVLLVFVLEEVEVVWLALLLLSMYRLPDADAGRCSRIICAQVVESCR